MKKRMPLIGLLAVLILFAHSVAARGHKKLPLPRPAPTTHLGNTVEGEAISLEQFKGQPVVLSFWHPQCAPCLHELPVLDQVQKRLGPQLVRIIAIGHHQNRKEARYAVRKLKKNGFALTFTYDPTGAVGRKFGVNAIPHLYIIGIDGNIVYEQVGWGDQSLRPILQTLKKEVGKAAQRKNDSPRDPSVSRLLPQTRSLAFSGTGHP
jgi:thiol-disulfide isomerase/thioredoxin